MIKFEKGNGNVAAVASEFPPKKKSKKEEARRKGRANMEREMNQTTRSLTSLLLSTSLWNSILGHESVGLSESWRDTIHISLIPNHVLFFESFFPSFQSFPRISKPLLQNICQKILLNSRKNFLHSGKASVFRMKIFLGEMFLICVLWAPDDGVEKEE